MGDQPSAGNQVQNTTSNSTSNSTMGPSPVIAPKLDQITNDFWSWYDQNGKAPAYFPNGTVAPMSTATTDALNALGARGADGTLAKAGSTFATDTLGGKFLDIDSNPYLQKALAATFRPQAEQLRDIVLPGIDAKFVGSGRTASGNQFDSNMRAVKDLETTQSDAAARAAAQVYGDERSRQLQTAGLLPSIQGLDYQNLAARLQSGQAFDAQAQRELDDANAKYMYGTTGQADWYTQMAQRLLAMYPGGATSGTNSGTGMTTGTGTPSSNPGASTTGTLMSGAGLAISAAGLFM